MTTSNKLLLGAIGLSAVLLVVGRAAAYPGCGDDDGKSYKQLCGDDDGKSYKRLCGDDDGKSFKPLCGDDDGKS